MARAYRAAAEGVKAPGTDLLQNHHTGTSTTALSFNVGPVTTYICGAAYWYSPGEPSHCTMNKRHAQASRMRGTSTSAAIFLDSRRETRPPLATNDASHDRLKQKRRP